MHYIAWYPDIINIVIKYNGASYSLLIMWLNKPCLPSLFDILSCTTGGRDRDSTCKHKGHFSHSHTLSTSQNDVMSLQLKV